MANHNSNGANPPRLNPFTGEPLISYANTMHEAVRERRENPFAKASPRVVSETQTSEHRGLFLCVYDSVTNTTPRQEQVSWDELAEKLTTHVETADKKSVELFACHELKSGTTRANNNVVNVHALVLDFDGKASIEEAKETIAGYEYALHTTYSHSEEEDRFRVVLPLKEPVAGNAWYETYERMVRGLGFEGLADNQFRSPSQGAFLPSKRPDARSYANRNRGAWISPDDFLELLHEPDRLPSISNGSAAAATLSATEVKDLATKAKNADKFHDLMAGDIRGYPSQSEADFALADLLCRLSDSDAVVEEIMKEATSWTPEREGKKGRGYLARTIRNARREVTESYIPSRFAEPATTEDVTEERLDIRCVRAVTHRDGAELLAHTYGEHIHYVTEWRRYVVWDGTRWQPDRDHILLHGLLDRLARRCMRQASMEGQRETQDLLLKLAKQLCNHDFGERILKALRSKAGIARDSEDFDANPWLLNAPNGTVDLRTGELKAHNPAELITKICTYAYDPEAEASRWEAFLGETLPNEDVRHYVHKCAGYSISGKSDERILLLIYGATGTGKSTFLHAMRGILGSDYEQTLNLEDLSVGQARPGGTSSHVVQLRGKRFAGLYESQPRRINATLVKSLTGNDPITATRKYCEPETFEPQHTLWIATNYRPTMPPDDGALYARLREIPFRVEVPDEKKDAHLLEKLLRDEGSGILAWAVRGCLLWQREGLSVPDEVKQATEENRKSHDRLVPFLESECKLGRGSVAKKAFTVAYKAWCEENGEKPLSARNIRLSLESHDCYEDRERSDEGRVSVWRGIHFRGDAE